MRTAHQASNANSKKRFLRMLVCATSLFASGCSAWVNSPQVARVEIRTLNHQLREMVIVLPPSEALRDINLNDRFAVQIDVQWLWTQTDESAPTLFDLDADDDPAAPASLKPWVTCKYRF